MKLKELMALENPTVEQFGQMESILLDTEQELISEIERLDADHRANSSNRVLGMDDGVDERAAARATAVARQADVQHVLGEVRNKKSALQRKQIHEVEQAAWASARGFLNKRRACAQEIESLLGKVVVLAGKENELWKEALAAAPITWDRERKQKVPRGLGGHSGDYFAAIVARMNLLLDQPFPKVYPHDELLPFTRRVSGEGIVGFLSHSDKALLTGS